MNRVSWLILAAIWAPITSAKLDPQQALSHAPPMAIFEAWAKPIEPFQMALQVWYVGTENLSSILITTPEGHLLIDAGLDQSAELIKSNIERLGFKVGDIQYLLNSHARLDQAGGLAKMKAWSGARLITSRENAKQLALGGAEDFALGDALLFPPVIVDREIRNRERFYLGGVEITALLTPGHLPGATSWKIKLSNKDVLIYADSLATPDYYLINNKNYPTIVDDLNNSFAVLSEQKVDIFIASKGERFNLKDKINQYKKGDQRAFYDREGLARYVDLSKAALNKQLEAQTTK
ncbi:HARLDQ motif MBL-fold protein [Acinetobacter pullicarnis]|uniref:HARLDQ motif MBL-fold protein n=1 Tax=Acinetobacter pullicarnis TaxID=2576829 RepID=UPI00112191A7|nr:HARLDQ motif MBL-fold protein [Acinetobacter pullicarnis]